MNREELMKLADSFQKKADNAFQIYQETGASRYSSTARRNEDIADALRMAVAAADEHSAYINLKMEMANLASRARKIMHSVPEDKKAELVETLVRDIITSGRLLGLIGGD